MTRRAAKGLFIYAVLVLLSASCRAWQVHSAPFDCADDAGHGPDPKTDECENIIVRARALRPEDTLNAFVGIFILGAAGLGGYGALRLSMRIGFVRRFADDDRPA
ncbi:MAG TPA: hypothetical protein VD887_03340 [Allosphingosinicella sp.]|nr:hypothetical protein [Allosphingosinicella sp.]